MLHMLCTPMQQHPLPRRFARNSRASLTQNGVTGHHELQKRLWRGVLNGRCCDPGEGLGGLTATGARKVFGVAGYQSIGVSEGV